MIYPAHGAKMCFSIGKLLLPIEAAVDRTQLLNTLLNLVEEDLKYLAHALEMPASLKPGVGASRGQWAMSLFEWAESATGCGFNKVLEEVQKLIARRTAPGGSASVGGNVTGSTTITGNNNNVTTNPQQTAPRRPNAQGSAASDADVLLVTVTAVETKAVFDAARALTGREARRVFEGNLTFYELGNICGANTWLVRSEMGPGGPGGALLTVSDGIRALSPDAVIMVGIAFGVDQHKQPIGQVLVSRQILDYELQRVGTAADGTEQIVARGDRPQASPRLLNRFRDGEISWQGAPVDFGLVLSGAKLVDNKDYRERLQALEPEALGGEMEGAGLYAAATAWKADWLLVKAVCDYADGYKRENKTQRQRLAADSAARFVMHVIAQGGLVGSKVKQLDPQ
ncbi:MAG: hypothetical protein H7Y22_05150 [Gemmatimonadaceae bacterium]|nr:hypothetical protein [Gloeobacterales cyanobacterium ES-bin-141]